MQVKKLSNKTTTESKRDVKKIIPKRLEMKPLQKERWSDYDDDDDGIDPKNETFRSP